MSVKDIENIKKHKPIRAADWILYGVLALVVLVLFIVFVFARPNEELTALCIDRDGERIVTFDFASGKAAVAANAVSSVEVKENGENGQVTITVFADEAHERFNVITVQTSDERAASVTDANCSAHRDCVHTSAVTRAGDIIVCVPHHLKVYGNEQSFNPSLG